MRILSIRFLAQYSQDIALFLPTVHIFETMRLILIENKIFFFEFFIIIFLNLFYLIASVLFFLKMIFVARRKGLLFNQGE